VSYATLDDKLPHHRKVRDIKPTLVLAAFGLHAAAICYCQNYGTDGRILLADFPLIMPVRPNPPRVLIDELVRVRLWDVHPEGGWTIHDYLEWNASAKERQAKARKASNARWNAHRNAPSNAPSNAGSNALLSSPTPTPLHSSPLHSSERGSELGATTMPDGFSANGAISAAARRYPTTEAEYRARVRDA
jgi:hypothetical protein